MDWHTWLSRTGLDPTLVHEYGVVFNQNELERDDIPYFDHEFLRSMGISIAKHRLEILKLAGKSDSHSSRAAAFTVSGALIAAVKRTKMCLSKRIRAWARRDDSAVVRICSDRWKESVAKRIKSRKLLLTNGSPDLEHEAVDDDRRIAGEDDIIRWDSMFQNLRPN